MAAVADYASIQAGPAVELHPAVQPAATFEGYWNDLNAPFRALPTTERPSIASAAPTCHVLLPSCHCQES
ncbi:MAG TPA: hypothetical protein VH833_06445 [Gemmatimonadales bacterium]